MLTALDLKLDIADRIVDWIDPDSNPELRDSENSAKNGYLDSIDELLLIPGIDRESYERLVPYVTIYSAEAGKPAQININGAAIPVLMSLPADIDAGVAESIVRLRESTPFVSESDVSNRIDKKTGIALSGYISFKGTAFHMLSTAQAGNIKRVIESVIEISGSNRTIRYWKES